jgi:2Fe-2S ferredoxin
MVEITYIEPSGAARKVQATPGATLMETARENDIEGIAGDCGGNCVCATCHIVLEADAYARLPAPESVEREMLDFYEGTAPTSRLGCQIKVTEALNGLTVRVKLLDA